VYAPADVQLEYAALVEKEPTDRVPFSDRNSLLKKAESKAAKPGKAPPTAPAESDDIAGKDDFLSKIAKYVPAETITITTLAFAALNPTGNDIWWILIAGAALNVLYLLSTALAAPKTPLPRWYFYFLSIPAYGLWAAAIIGAVGGKVGIGGADAEIEQTFVLALAAFLVPALDTIASHLAVRQEAAA
jgi:hypothetical protein